MHRQRAAQAILFASINLLVAPSGIGQQKLPRFEVGPVFSYLRIPYSPPINEQNHGEIGLRFSYNVKKSFALEGEFDASPFKTPNLSTSYQGGHVSQGFFGLKGGKRWDKVGLFAKFRPGFISFSRVITGVSSTTPALLFQFGRRTDLAFDVGGAVEVYLSRRVMLRYDFGDTIIHYNELTFHSNEVTSTVPGVVRNNFQFSTAVAFRF